MEWPLDSDHLHDEERMITSRGLLEDSRSVPFDVAIELRKAPRVAR